MFFEKTHSFCSSKPIQRIKYVCIFEYVHIDVLHSDVDVVSMLFRDQQKDSQLAWNVPKVWAQIKTLNHHG